MTVYNENLRTFRLLALFRLDFQKRSLRFCLLGIRGFGDYTFEIASPHRKYFGPLCAERSNDLESSCCAFPERVRENPCTKIVQHCPRIVPE